jgi:hypothetical protein
MYLPLNMMGIMTQIMSRQGFGTRRLWTISIYHSPGEIRTGYSQFQTKCASTITATTTNNNNNNNNVTYMSDYRRGLDW